MAQIVTARAMQRWGTGREVFEAVVPLAVEAVRIAVDRTQFTGPEIADAIKLDWWLSQDGGVSWGYQGGVGIPIGVARVSGTTIAESGMQRAVPGTGNPLRRVRVQLHIVSQAVNTALTLTLLP